MTELKNENELEMPENRVEGSHLTRQTIDVEMINGSVQQVKQEIQKVVVGQDELINLLLAGLFTGGHILIEGVPGIAKTLTANMLAKSLSLQFSRIQFTPDLMPADVTGTSVFSQKKNDFEFRQGPIFSNLVLIDEINRSPAKTQAALFEVMEERQITNDGTTYKLNKPFMVVATQNPIEQEGTYRLPEAQQDRFLFKINLLYPSLEEEIGIIKRFEQDFNQNITDSVNQVLDGNKIEKCMQEVEKVFIKNELMEYIARIIDHTRNTKDLFLGASPRASLAILKTSKAIAAINGRDFVTPDDIQYVTLPVLNHRIILTPEKEMEGFDVKDVIKDIIQRVEVPR